MTISGKHRSDAPVTARAPTAAVIRSQPALKSNYSEYRDTLRWDFWYSCAYCTLTESEAAAVGFNIDHYLPRARYPELANDYSNLFWSCAHCNGFKQDYPTEAAALKGYRFYRADMDEPSEHFAHSKVNPTRIEPLSEEIGRYTIEQLNLNRKSLRVVRDLRERFFGSKRDLINGLRQLEGLRLDSLPRETRTKFIRARARLTTNSQKVADAIDEFLLREFNRSELLDPAETNGHCASERKRYLRTVNAAIPTP